MIYQYTKELSDSFSKLLNHLEEMSPKERTLVEGIGAFGVKSGKISYRQLVTMGRIYKKYVHEEEYVHHDWKIWKKV